MAAKRRGVDLRRVCLALAVVLAPTGCHHKLPKLAAAGKHAEVIERVQNSRRLPKGKAARAYATSLAAVDRVDEARGFLMRDFRHTGDVRSLVALADLEVQHGLRGVALTRYSRAHTLNNRALRGRTDVCDLLRERARQFLAEGEGLAADQDMRRAINVCAQTSPSDAPLLAEIKRAAGQQARDQRTLVACRQPECPQASGPVGEALIKARGEGALALAVVARRRGVQLPPNEVVDLLRADLAGELGVDLVTHDQLRAWVGDQALPELEKAVVAHPSAAVQAYARLRFSLLGPAYTLGETAAPSVNRDVLNRADGAPPSTSTSSSNLALSTVLERLSEQTEIPESNGWRVLALVGDLRAVEFELGTGLRNRAAASSHSNADISNLDADTTTSTGQGSGGVAGATAPPVHWAATGPVDPSKLVDLLSLARLRGTRDNADQALEIARFALAEAHRGGVSQASQLARQEAWHRLASGQPWQAIALMDSLPAAHDSGIERAAGSAIALRAAVCGESCPASEDRGIVGRVMGEPWLQQQQKRLLQVARTRSSAAALPGACPTLRELLVGDAVGPLATALREARTDVTAPGVAERLRSAVESDLTLACAGRHATSVMLMGGHKVTAEVLADELSQAPQIIASGQLELQAELAVVAGRREQAELMSKAAGGASVAPQAYWRRAAEFGRLAADRDFEAHSLRQAILHAPSEQAADLRRALIVRTLLDASLGEALRDSDVPAAQDAFMHQTAEYFDDLPPELRWHEREVVARAVAAQGRLDDTALSLIRQALWPESLAMMRHPTALATLELSRGQPMIALTPDTLAPQQWAAVVRWSKPEQIPAKMALLCPAHEVLAGRLVLAEHASNQVVRRSSAIAVATSGNAAQREQAILLLLQDLARAGAFPQRERVLALLLDGIAASEGPGLPPQPVISDQRRLLMAAVGSSRRDGFAETTADGS